MSASSLPLSLPHHALAVGSTPITSPLRTNDGGTSLAHRLTPKGAMHSDPARAGETTP